MAYNGHYIESNYLVHFLSLSLLFFDAAYISYKNVKCNKVLNHFSLLLLLLGWQFLLYLFDFQPISKAVSMLLLPVCFYRSAYFIQTFLFQGSAYRGQKALLVFLKISCVTAIICFFFSDRAFFTAYQLQFFYLDTGSCCRWYHTEKTNCLCAEKSKETSAFSTGSCSNSICNIPFRFSQGSGIYGKHGELHPRYAGICMYS